MKRRRWHDYDDGFDEALLWGDEDSDLDSDLEFDGRWELDDEPYVELREDSRRRRRRKSGYEKSDDDERRLKRKRDFDKAWGTAY